MVYWIWLQSALGYGGKGVRELTEKFGTAKRVYEASINDLKFYGRFSEKTSQRLNDKCLDTARKVLNECKNRGVTVIPYVGAQYPELLKQIHNPPAVLYAKGDLSLLNDTPTVCIVGPREVTDYGKKSAFSLSARLSAGGFAIVSGGAKGSDTAVHKGALAVGGKTICVLARGIGDDYLKLNAPLREEISVKGLLISEFQPDTPVAQNTFNIRNRIMSGLSLGTVVVEAPEISGALITANHAAEQNRDVFVIPGTPSVNAYKGSNLLLRDGARPLLEANDVFFEYLPLYPHKINPEKAHSTKIKMSAERETPSEYKPNAQNSVSEKDKNTVTEKFVKKIVPAHLSNNAKIVYNLLDKQFFYSDEINSAALSDSQLLAALTELEIFGLISAQPGGKYMLK